MKKLNLDMAKHQHKFKDPLYQQAQYWDKVHKMLGHRVTDERALETNNLMPNETETAYIEGGDTAMRMGLYYTAIRLLEKNGYDVGNLKYNTREEQEDFLDKLDCKWTWGLYRRHPEPTMWYADEHRGSRDNTKTLISSEGFLNTKSSFKRLGLFILRHLLFRGLLFDAKTKANGASIETHYKGTHDYGFKFPVPTLFTVWASYVRSLIMKHKAFYTLYPLLLIFDIEIVLNAVVKHNRLQKLLRKDKTKLPNVANHVAYSCWFAEVAPTPWIGLMNRYINRRGFLNKYFFARWTGSRSPWVVPVMYEELMRIYIRRE